MLTSILPHALLVFASPVMKPAAQPPSQVPAASQQQDAAIGTPLETVAVPLRSGGELAVDRGQLQLPVVRGREGSGVLSVEFHRFHGSQAQSGRPPIFLLQGGPGFRGLRAPLSRPGFFEDNLEPLTRLADVVVVGQRGIGSSEPDTRCQPYQSLPLDRAIPAKERAAAVRAGVEACRESWLAQGLDLEGFTVLEAADDVIAVATALGYGKITLLGGSFGSHWGMAILRRHPERVARAVLHGIEGPDHTYDRPRDVLAALARIAAAAEAAEGLENRLPEGGLLSAFQGLAQELDAKPRIVSVGKTKVWFDGDRLREMSLGVTRRASSRGGIRQWPADLIALISGDLQAAAGQIVRKSFFGHLPTASFFLLDCSSGISPERQAELQADPAQRIVGDLGQFYDWTCPTWKVDLGPDFRAPFACDVPTLLVQGTWDTSTPLENALELAPAFTRSRLVLVHGGSHAALSEARRADPDFARALEAFLSEGNLEGMPAKVQLPALDWVVPD